MFDKSVGINLLVLNYELNFLNFVVNFKNLRIQFESQGKELLKRFLFQHDGVDSVFAATTPTPLLNINSTNTNFTITDLMVVIQFDYRAMFTY